MSIAVCACASARLHVFHNKNHDTKITHNPPYDPVREHVLLRGHILVREHILVSEHVLVRGHILVG
jgi:hypothetical protein